MWAFEDGAVDRGEYIRAFDEFVTCAKERGIEITGGELKDDGLIHYGFPTGREEDEIANECYGIHFWDIDANYQLTDPDVQAYKEARDRQFLIEEVFPCLAKHGLDVPTDADPALLFDGEFMRGWVELDERGDC